MKIEVKNLKHSASLSEETHAYTATIYINGKKAFHASNHGHGGADFYQPVAGYTGPSLKEIDAWLAKNKPLKGQFKDLDNCLEFVVSDMINETLTNREFNRLLRNKILVLDQGALYHYNVKPTPENLNRYKNNFAVKGQIVNGNPQLEAEARRKLG